MPASASLPSFFLYWSPSDQVSDVMDLKVNWRMRSTLLFFLLFPREECDLFSSHLILQILVTSSWKKLKLPFPDSSFWNHQKGTKLDMMERDPHVSSFSLEKENMLGRLKVWSPFGLSEKFSLRVVSQTFALFRENCKFLPNHHRLIAMRIFMLFLIYTFWLLLSTWVPTETLSKYKMKDKRCADHSCFFLSLVGVLFDGSLLFPARELMQNVNWERHTGKIKKNDACERCVCILSQLHTQHKQVSSCWDSVEKLKLSC